MDLEALERTVRLLSGHPYELRTTVVPGMHTPEDIAAIGHWMAGIAATSPFRNGLKQECTYVLQAFRPDASVLGPAYRDLRGFDRSHMESFRAAAAPYFARVLVQGGNADSEGSPGRIFSQREECPQAPAM